MKCLRIAALAAAAFLLMLTFAVGTKVSHADIEQPDDTAADAIRPVEAEPTERAADAGGGDERATTEAGPAEHVESSEGARPADITDEVHNILTALAKKYDSIEGFHAKFKRTSFDKVFEMAGTVETGQVYVKKPQMLRLETKKPTERLEIINENQIIEFRPSLKMATVVHREPGRQDSALSGIGRAAEDVERNFIVTLQASEKTRNGFIYNLKLVPRDKRKSDYEELHWWIDSATWLPVRISIADTSKEWTYAFSDIDATSDIKDERFREPKWPVGVRVDRK